MPDPTTLELALLQISDALEPLGYLFEPARAQQSFREIGIVVDAAQVDALAAPIQNLAACVQELVTQAVSLRDAIDAGDIAGIGTSSANLVGLLATVMGRIDDLQGAVRNLSGVPVGIADQLAERLFNALLVETLSAAAGANEILELFGILLREHINAGSTDPANPDHIVPTFRFDALGRWLADPLAEFEARYGWDSAGFDGVELLTQLEKLLLALNVPAFLDDSIAEPTLDVVLAQIKARPDLNPSGLAVIVNQEVSPGTLTVDFDDLTVELDLEARLPFGAELIIQPPTEFSFTVSNPTDVVAGSFELRLTADRSAAASPYLLIGENDGSRLEFGSLALTAGGRFSGSGNTTTGDVSIGGNVGGGKLLVSLAGADGFIGNVFGGIELASDFAFAFGVTAEDGVYFEGSSTLQVQLPVHVNLGPVDISALTFSVGLDGEAFPVAIGADVNTLLGPMSAVVENIGVQADVRLTDDRDGSAGLVDVDMGFLPPNGVALAIDVGVVKGGGYLYFDHDNEEYAGALELDFNGIVTVKAIGLISTRLPDGSDGFSLLVIVSAEFGTPFQLGFGFTLNALGGLLGLNRTMELEVIAEGVRTGAIDSVMFPDDIIENAPRIISDLQDFFPTAEDTFLVGPMAMLGWGTPTIVTASLGVMMEIPPGNIAILGVLKVALPDDDAALIVVQVNFIGALELDKQRLWFYASLYESRVLFITLEGDMGLLVAWGDAADFVLSIGGFHPTFSPPPLPFPDPRRISISILNESFASIRVDGYFAVTANTAQFGASAELFFGLNEFNIQGHVSFDALFQFSPFYFVISYSSSMDVKVFGVGLYSVRMRGELEGTSPWHVEGEGSISLLFFDIDIPFSHTWGENENTTLPPIDIMPLLETELNKLDNWTASLPEASNLLVSLREVETTDELILHPVGVLRVSQRAIPLDLDLDKFGNQSPRDATRVTLELLDADIDKIADTSESFATGQFKKLSDAARLSSPAYESQHAGMELSVSGSQSQSHSAIKRVVRYEEIVIDNNFKGHLVRFVGFALDLFHHFLGGNAASQSTLSATVQGQRAPVDQRIRVLDAGYAVASSADNTAHDGTATFTSYAAAQDFMRAEVDQTPGLNDALHVIPASELRVAA